MKKLVAVAGAFVTFSLSAIAHASPVMPVLTLTDLATGTTVSVSDGSSLDTSAAAGTISFSGAVGNYWANNVTTGVSKSPTGSISLNSVDVSTKVNGKNGENKSTLRITFEDAGFAIGTGSVPATTAATMGITGFAAPDTTISFWAYLNGQLINELGPLKGLGAAKEFSADSVDPVTTTDPFGLKEIIEISHVGSRTTQFSSGVDIAPVPEPGTMMLLGAGFLGLAVYGKRRKNA